MPGDPATTNGATSSPTSREIWGFSYNGAIGQVPDADCMADSNCKSTIAASGIDGHVDPRQIMDVGVMNGNIPAPAHGD